MIKQNKRDVERAATIKKTAELVGVSKRYVRMVMDGDRESETVTTVFMELTEGKNALLEEVKKLIPFN